MLFSNATLQRQFSMGFRGTDETVQVVPDGDACVETDTYLELGRIRQGSHKATYDSTDQANTLDF